MRTLLNHKLLIDADCPMCRIYSSSFEKTNMLAKGSASPFQITDNAVLELVNMQKAKNEIALINTITHEVTYGLDSLKKIITHSLPALNPILNFAPIDWFFKKLYKFISFNRKVIVPAKSNAFQRSCTPDFNLKYRLVFMLFVVIFSSIVLFKFTQPINELMGWQSHLGREFLMCFGQILWQFMVLSFLFRNIKNESKFKKIMEYLGNMMTVSLIGTLLLLPMIIIQNLPAFTYLFYFGGVVGIMLMEHIRRTKILEIGWIPTVSWLAYRAVVLVVFEAFK
jgi:hypothetical protein